MYEGKHRVERIEAMLTRTGWGPFRLPGERRRLVASQDKARRVMRMAAEAAERGEPTRPVCDCGEFRCRVPR